MDSPAGQASSARKVLLLVEGLRVADVPANDYNGSILTPMRVLHSITASKRNVSTALSVTQAVMSPYVQNHNYCPPDHPKCITHFMSMKSKMIAPFRATLRGTIASIQAIDQTQQGQGKRMFALVDEMGSWLQCCAVGRHAFSAALADGNEVVAYYATARAGWGSVPACVWLFKDATLVFVSKKTVTLRAHLEM